MVDNAINIRKRSIYEVLVKRPLDFALSSVAILVLSPVLAGIALWVKSDSEGGILFRQERIGKDGNPFMIYKFRTMLTSAPNVATAEFENPEDYITRSGKILRKFSLDELPQFFNVWKGEMSFVGPRPLIPDEKHVLQLRHLNGAEQILPGITGWAQVNGRDEVTAEDKARLDGEYAKQISFAMDLRILFKTAFDVLRSKGVHEGKQ